MLVVSTSSRRDQLDRPSSMARSGSPRMAAIDGVGDVVVQTDLVEHLRGRPRPGPLDHPLAPFDGPRPGVGEGQQQLVVGGGVDELVGQPVEPRPHRLLPARCELLAQLGRDQREGGVELAGVEVVVDGPARVPVGGEPLGRPLVALSLEVGPRRAGLAAQQLAEQVVVAEPLAFVVERHQEQVLGLDAPQQGPGVGATGHVDAQVGPQPLEHRRGEQELAHVVGLARRAPRRAGSRRRGGRCR